jgi:Ca2+-binding EF-hand superfamily protein
MDDNRSGSLDLPEFAKGVAESKLDITDVDVRVLFNAFDRDGNGTIDYDEFLRVVKGDMPVNRRKLVEKAYRVLDKDGSGEVDYNDICDVYNAKKHPAVLEGRKTERQVLEEFLSTFEMALSGKADGIVTLDEFIEYYTAVSASIDNEDYFAQMMNSSWNIKGDASQYKSYSKGWSNKDDDAAPKKAAAGGGGAGTYGGPSKKATGQATMYSGVQSADNPFQSSTQHYQGRGAPQRKSLAHTAQKKTTAYNYREAPGQESTGNVMSDAQQSQHYQNSIKKRQGEDHYPQPGNAESVNA